MYEVLTRAIMASEELEALQKGRDDILKQLTAAEAGDYLSAAEFFATNVISSRKEG